MGEKVMSEVLQTQGPCDVEKIHVPSIAELYELAESHFPGAMEHAYNEYLSASQHKGRLAVIDRLSLDVVADSSTLAHIRAHFGQNASDTETREYFSSQMMSFILQSYGSSTDPMVPSVKFKTIGASAPSWLSPETKDMEIESIETPEAKNLVLEAFEDARALKLSLLLNQLLNSPSWQDLHSVALRPYQFEMGYLDKQSGVARSLHLTTIRANRLLEFMKPALEVNIGSHSVVGGSTDLSVQICSTNGQQKREYEYTAVVKLDKPCMVYRAANYLVFGDEPSNDDYVALKSSSAGTLESASQQLQATQQHGRVKHVVSKDDEGIAVKGYTRGCEDITQTLRECHLKQPLDALHRSLLHATRQASINKCRHAAVCDGFSFIGTHLREIKEPKRGLLTASFNSHHAVDMTETGSSVKALQYFINTAFESGKVRRYFQYLLNAASKCFESEDITIDRVNKFKELERDAAQSYRFHTQDDVQDDSLAGNAKIFMRNWKDYLEPVLDHLRREYGAFFPYGDYERDMDGWSTVEYIRVNEREGLDSKDPSVPGRCYGVHLLDYSGKRKGMVSLSRYFIIKKYRADLSSIDRMERELRAYRRISQLNEEDRKHFPKVVMFGSSFSYVCFIAEYVEDPPVEPPYEKLAEEIGRVRAILKSIGVHHNDLHEGNYRWQLKDGEWYIKVFDFDNATFDPRHNSLGCTSAN